MGRGQEVSLKSREGLSVTFLKGGVVGRAGAGTGRGSVFLLVSVLGLMGARAACPRPLGPLCGSGPWVRCERPLQSKAST